MSTENESGTINESNAVEFAKDLNLIEFLNISDESTRNTPPDESHGTNIVTEKLCDVSNTQIKNQLSYKSVTDVITLMNEMPGAQVKIPERKSTFQRITAKLSPVKPIFLIFCEKCSELVEDRKPCECGLIAKKNSKKNNFLVYFPLIPQVLRILRIHFKQIIDHIRREHVAGEISDIDDGKIYSDQNKKNSEILPLTLTMNLDGASIFKSSRGSLWPVQFYLNFLPPAIRYMPENMIVSILYYGVVKPDMNKLLYPIAREIEINKEQSMLTSEGELLNFEIRISIVACDLPAKAAVQNFIGHNGKFGCSFCYHPGMPIANSTGKGKTIRFVELNHTSQLRTHDETIQQSTKCSEKNILQGIKGISSVLMFPGIDLIKSFPIDIMHGVGLGIMKDLIAIWMGKKKLPTPPYKEYKLTPNNREILNSRILKLKPPSSVRRKPKSIFEFSDFKASECLNFLWFYLRYTLPGLLPTKLVKNFEKLASATYTLCKENITLCEVNSANEMLVDFAIEYESIYGQGAVTMNLHLLKHYRDSVLNCGPMWAYSLFGFENNIGVIKKFVFGKTDVLDQIYKKYIASKIDNELSNFTADDCVELKQQIRTELDITEYVPILLEVGVDADHLQRISPNSSKADCLLSF